MSEQCKYAAPKEVIRFARKHEHGEFNHVDAAVIALLGNSYLSLLDISLLRVSDVVRPSGDLVGSFTYSGNDKPKFVLLDGYLKAIMGMVVERRVQFEHGVTNVKEYGGLDPDSRFFLDANGREFKLRKKKVGDKVFYEARGLKERFETYVLPVGWKPAMLNDSFLNAVWREASIERQAHAIKLLEEVTGLTPNTIRKKTQKEPESVADVVGKIF